MLLVIGAEGNNRYELESVAASFTHSELESNKHRVDQFAVFTYGRMLGELT